MNIPKGNKEKMMKKVKQILVSLLAFTICVSSITFSGCEKTPVSSSQSQSQAQSEQIDSGYSDSVEDSTSKPSTQKTTFTFTVYASKMHTDLQLS